MKIIAGILYVSGGLVFGWAICFGDWITALAMAVAAATVSLPTVLITKDNVEQDARGKLQGSIHAANAAFMRELKEMDLNHSSQVRQLANDEGAAKARAEAAEQKIHRMTSRPRIRGRIAKRADAALIEQHPPQITNASEIKPLDGPL